MNYWRLRYLDTAARGRAVKALKRLRGALNDAMPRRTAEGTLLLGTWNIRNFDDNRFSNGPRMPETFFYIAEVVSRFDALAVQEICTDLAGLQHLMTVLGHEHDFLITDTTMGQSGNDERLGFLYHRDKVSFEGIAGEIVLLEKLLISDVTKKRQFARTPFACAFQCGWLKFVFATVHIYYGAASKTSNAYKRRVKEIEAVARVLAKRAKDEDHAYVLVGDFNIDKPGDPAADALQSAGFTMVRNKTGSNRTLTKFFDQISFMAREGEVRMASAGETHGVLNLFDSVFRDEDLELYDDELQRILGAKVTQLQANLAGEEAGKPSAARAKRIGKLQQDIAETQETLGKKALREAYYLTEWRTFQMSDHLPLWVELDVDFAEDYLNRLESQS